MKLGHVAIRVKDIDTMLDFYCVKIGLKEAFRIYNDDSSLRIVYIHISEGQYLELCLGGIEKPAFDDKTSIGVRHICFTCEDIEKTKESLEQKGVSFDSEILNLKDNNKTAYFFDPEGNKLELTEISSESPQSEFQKSF